MLRKIIFACVFSLLFVVQASAVPLVIDSISEPRPLLDELLWLEDPHGVYTIDNVSSAVVQPSFQSLQYGMPLKVEGAVWLKLSLARGQRSLAGLRNVGQNLSLYLSDVGGQSPEVYVKDSLQGGLSHSAWVRTILSPNSPYIVSPFNHSELTLFIYFPEAPSLWFHPYIQASSLDHTSFLPLHSILLGLLGLGIVANLLRGLKEREMWRCWAALSGAFMLLGLSFHASSSASVSQITDLPYLLGPGLVLFLIPHIGRGLLQSYVDSTLQDRLLYACSFLGVFLVLVPLLPSNAWLLRLLPLWSLLLFPLLAICLWALQAERQGGLAYTLFCLLPFVGGISSFIAIDSLLPHQIAVQGAAWGFAIGALGLLFVPKLKDAEALDTDADFPSLEGIGGELSEQDGLVLSPSYRSVTSATGSQEVKVDVEEHPLSLRLGDTQAKNNSAAEPSESPLHLYEPNTKKLELDSIPKERFYQAPESSPVEDATADSSNKAESEAVEKRVQSFMDPEVLAAAQQIEKEYSEFSEENDEDVDEASEDLSVDTASSQYLGAGGLLKNSSADEEGTSPLDRGEVVTNLLVSEENFKPIQGGLLGDFLPSSDGIVLDPKLVQNSMQSSYFVSSSLNGENLDGASPFGQSAEDPQNELSRSGFVPIKDINREAVVFRAAASTNSLDQAFSSHENTSSAAEDLQQGGIGEDTLPLPQLTEGSLLKQFTRANLFGEKDQNEGATEVQAEQDLQKNSEDSFDLYDLVAKSVSFPEEFFKAYKTNLTWSFAPTAPRKLKREIKNLRVVLRQWFERVMAEEGIGNSISLSVEGEPIGNSEAIMIHFCLSDSNSNPYNEYMAAGLSRYAQSQGGNLAFEPASVGKVVTLSLPFLLLSSTINEETTKSEAVDYVHLGDDDVVEEDMLVNDAELVEESGLVDRAEEQQSRPKNFATELMDSAASDSAVTVEYAARQEENPVNNKSLSEEELFGAQTLNAEENLLEAGGVAVEESVSSTEGDNSSAETEQPNNLDDTASYFKPKESSFTSEATAHGPYADERTRNESMESTTGEFETEKFFGAFTDELEDTDEPLSPGAEEMPLVLVGDMTMSNVRLICHYLGQKNYQYEVVKAGNSLASLYEQFPSVGLLIVDLDMPDADLQNDLKTIRSFELLHEKEAVPILALISHETQLDRARSYACLSVIIKPFTQEEFTRVVDLAVKGIPSLSSNGVANAAVQKGSSRPKPQTRSNEDYIHKLLDGSIYTLPNKQFYEKKGADASKKDISNPLDDLSALSRSSGTLVLKQKEESTEDAYSEQAEDPEFSPPKPVVLSKSNADSLDVEAHPLGKDLEEHNDLKEEEPNLAEQRLLEQSRKVQEALSLAHFDSFASSEPTNEPSKSPSFANEVSPLTSETSSTVSSFAATAAAAASSSASEKLLPSSMARGVSTAQSIVLPDMGGESIQRVMLPLVPQMVASLREGLALAHKALGLGQFDVISLGVAMITAQSNLFQLEKLGKVATCVERAAAAQDMEAVAVLIEDLDSVTKRYIDSLESCYALYNQYSSTGM